jgi:hypothetical protein
MTTGRVTGSIVQEEGTVREKISQETDGIEKMREKLEKK